MLKYVWDKRMYIGNSLVHSKRKTIGGIKRKKLLFDVYIIAISENEHDLFDIYNSYTLYQKNFPENKLHIVGIGKGIDEIYEILAAMVNDCYKKYNHYNLKELFGEEI